MTWPRLQIEPDDSPEALGPMMDARNERSAARMAAVNRDGCCGEVETAHACGGWCKGVGMCPALAKANELAREMFG